MRRFGRWMLLACLAGAVALGQVNPPKFGDRPRLEHTQAELDAWPRERIDACIAKAEAVLTRGLVVSEKEGQWIFYYACPDHDARLKPEAPDRHVCPRCGKVYDDARTQAAYQTVLHYQLDEDLHTLAQAWAVSRDDRFAAPVRQAMLKLADRYPTFERHDRWGRRGMLAILGGRRYCQHLDEAVSVITLARAYDYTAMSPVWSEADQQRVEQGLLRWICAEIQGKAWMMIPRNNHQTWFNAAYATVGVAIGDAELLHAAIQAPGAGMLWQLENSVTEDGIWYEGTMAYHFYALAAIIDTLHAVRRAGWTFTGDARLQRLWLGPLQLAYPNGQFPVINDSDPFGLQGRSAIYSFARAYFDDPRYETAGATRPLTSAALKGAGLVVLRRGAGPQARCLFLDYGIHGGDHGHPDKLNITLFTQGREWVLDPGRLTYSVPEHLTWARKTVAHNTLVINGRDQQVTEGCLRWFEETPAYAGTLAETTGAYPGYTLRRGLLMTEEWLLDVLTVTGKTPATLDWLLHVRGELQEQGEPAESAGLGKDNGYQHLRQVARHPADRRRYSFAQPKVGSLTVDVWPATETWSGTGIGYSLKEAVPFLLRRRCAATAEFVALTALGGTGVSLGKVSMSGTRLHAIIETPTGLVQVTFDTAPDAKKRVSLAGGE